MCSRLAQAKGSGKHIARHGPHLTPGARFALMSRRRWRSDKRSLRRETAMDPWTRNRWRRRWRRIRPLIVATVLAVLTVLILLAIAQRLEGAGRAGPAASNEERPAREIQGTTGGPLA
jgi:uncharacterized membrane protein YdfJ with MMPL/SSD domain